MNETILYETIAAFCVERGIPLPQINKVPRLKIRYVSKSTIHLPSKFDMAYLKSVLELYSYLMTINKKAESRKSIDQAA